MKFFQNAWNWTKSKAGLVVNGVKTFAVTAATGVAAYFGMGSTSAHAAVDVSDAVTAINDALTPLGLIGGAVIAVLAGLIVFKLAKRLM